MQPLFFALIAAALPLSAPAIAADCASLAGDQLPNTTIQASEVPAGTFHPPYGDPVTELPTFCRVTGVIRPSSDSDIRFEVWLPETGWNGKYLGVGNGGFAGSIDFRTLGGNLKNGYATAATDTGHQGEAGDASWAYRHPEKLIDFGWRALHLTTENAKKLVAAYYGSAPKHSYFDSCSNGGREALMEAQRFPEDFDGILAGAPASYWTSLVSSGAPLFQALKNPASYISPLKLAAVNNAVLAACGSQSGVRDGFVDDPPNCHFDPSQLLCTNQDDVTCLTKPQIGLLKTIYAGVKDADGQQLFPGHPPGGELGGGGWGAWILGGAPAEGYGSAYYRNYFRYVIFDNPTWDPFEGKFSSDVKLAEQKTGKNLNAINPDLSAFAKRGGKLILYHGWSDPAIPPQNAITYYESVRNFMHPDAANQFVRLYMVPGMQHCVGGPGPNAFGQLGLASTGEGVRTALEHWVENGAAPGDLVARKYRDDHFGGDVERTRPLCTYPKVPKYKGSGDPNQAASFECR